MGGGSLCTHRGTASGLVLVYFLAIAGDQEVTLLSKPFCASLRVVKRGPHSKHPWRNWLTSTIPPLLASLPDRELGFGGTGEGGRWHPRRQHSPHHPLPIPVALAAGLHLQTAAQWREATEEKVLRELFNLISTLQIPVWKPNKCKSLYINCRHKNIV